jgi:hypothetical protein
VAGLGFELGRQPRQIVVKQALEPIASVLPEKSLLAASPSVPKWSKSACRNARRGAPPAESSVPSMSKRKRRSQAGTEPNIAPRIMGNKPRKGSFLGLSLGAVPLKEQHRDRGP